MHIRIDWIAVIIMLDFKINWLLILRITCIVILVVGQYVLWRYYKFNYREKYLSIFPIAFLSVLFAAPLIFIFIMSFK